MQGTQGALLALRATTAANSDLLARIEIRGNPCPLKIVFLPHCETASEGGIFHRVKSEAVSRIKKLIWDKTHSHLFRVQRFVSIGRWRGVHLEDEVQAGEEDDICLSFRSG